MAKGGAFNVSQLIRELGLQTVSGEDMRVLETIQPVMTVGDLSDTTPPHVAASAFFGVNAIGVGGLNGIIEVQCLAPGGLFIEWISVVSPAADIRMQIRDAAVGGGLPVLDPAGITSRDTPVSVVRFGAAAAPSGRFVLVGQTGTSLLFSPNQIFVPRGSFFSLQLLLANLSGSLGFQIREVPASEHSPT